MGFNHLTLAKIAIYGCKAAANTCTGWELIELGDGVVFEMLLANAAGLLQQSFMTRSEKMCGDYINATSEEE
jgi:hypothetical protein